MARFVPALVIALLLAGCTEENTPATVEKTRKTVEPREATFGGKKVSEWIALLADHEDATRDRAIKALVAIGEEAVPALEEAAEADDMRTKQGAIEAMEQIARNNAKSQPASDASSPKSQPASDASSPRVLEVPTLTVVTRHPAHTLDPHATSNSADVAIVRQVFQTLVRVDPTDPDRMIPELAQRWEVSRDGLTLTFTLREGVRFHDGQELTAQAVKLSLERARKTGPYSPELQRIKELSAQGPRTLSLRLASPEAPLMLRRLGMFAASVVSPRVLQAIASKSEREATVHLNQHPIGTGPYKVQAFRPERGRARLVGHKAYWGGAPAYDQVEFQSGDVAVGLGILSQSRGVLVLGVPPQHWARLEKDDRVSLRTWWALNVCYLGISGVHERTRDPRVRRAIQLAVDRAELLEAFGGIVRPTYSLIAQPFAAYDPNLRVEGWSPVVAERRQAARTLLEVAGAVGRKLTLWIPRDPRPYLPDPRGVADRLKWQLERVGLGVRVESVPNFRLFGDLPTNRYELVLSGWMADMNDPDNFYSPLTDGQDGRPSEVNISRLFDVRIHERLVAARRLTDPSRAYREIEADLQNRIRGYVPLVNTRQAVAWTSGLKGIEVDPLGEVRLRGSR